MNKKLFLLLAAPMMLTGCIKYNGIPQNKPNTPGSHDNPSGGGGGQQDDPSGGGGGGQTSTEVTTYLVLSSVGLYKGQAGTDISAKFIENAVEFKAKAGDPLPGKDDVTHVYKNCTFTSWVSYEGQGSPTVYTTVPSTSGKILYATFTATGDNPVTPDTGDETTQKTFYLNTNIEDGGGNWATSDPSFFAYCWGDGEQAYPLVKFSESLYTFSIPVEKAYTGLLFVRMSSGSSFTTFQAYSGEIWNQTTDLSFNDPYRTAVITTWGAMGENSGVRWSK